MPNLIKQVEIVCLIMNSLNSIIVFGLFFDLYSPDISLDQNERLEIKLTPAKDENKKLPSVKI